jgi:hypothetical protein
MQFLFAGGMLHLAICVITRLSFNHSIHSSFATHIRPHSTVIHYLLPLLTTLSPSLHLLFSLLLLLVLLLLSYGATHHLTQILEIDVDPTTPDKHIARIGRVDSIDSSGQRVIL